MRWLALLVLLVGAQDVYAAGGSGRIRTRNRIATTGGVSYSFGTDAVTAKEPSWFTSGTNMCIGVKASHASWSFSAAQNNLVRSWASAAGTNDFGMWINNTNQFIFMVYTTNSSTWKRVTYSLGTLAAGSTHEFVGCTNGGLLTAYVDGVAGGSADSLGGGTGTIPDANLPSFVYAGIRPSGDFPLSGTVLSLCQSKTFSRCVFTGTDSTTVLVSRTNVGVASGMCFGAKFSHPTYSFAANSYVVKFAASTLVNDFRLYFASTGVIGFYQYETSGTVYKAVTYTPNPAPVAGTTHTLVACAISGTLSLLWDGSAVGNGSAGGGATGAVSVVTSPVTFGASSDMSSTLGGTIISTCQAATAVACSL